MIKKYLPTSLFGRTFLIIVIPVLILQIAVSLVFFDRHWSKMTERLAFAVAGEMLVAINEMKTNPDNMDKVSGLLARYMDLRLNIQTGVQEFPKIIKDRELEGQGRFASNWDFQDDIEDALSNELRKITNIPFYVHSIPTDKNVLVYFLVYDNLLIFNVPERRLFSSSSYIFILWMVALSLLLFTIAIIFMRNQIRPIYRLGIIAERLGRGIPVGNIKPSGAREVRQAAQAFTKMQERINQYIQGRTTMLAGVSHDLRTPLTRMKLQLELMDEGEDKAALQGDIADMEKMIEGYLSFAKGDGGEEMQRINLKDLMDKVIDHAKRLSLNVEDSRQNEDDIMIWAKPVVLLRAFDNFIANAAQYADTIQITTEISYDTLRILFEDNGSGIAEEKLSEVMKPFVRGEESRNKKTGGVGLGLTIANDIITSHGGTVNLQKSQNLGGLKVTVMLPL